ncbi:MAG: tetratricopeptide repeat protein [Planctomycetota bacterium]
MTQPIAPNDASAPLDRVPFFRDFSCRRRELEKLRACLRATLAPEQLDAHDREHLDGLSDSESPEQVGLRPLALVGGESGMGKSRLSHELKAEAIAAGANSKEMFCFERQGVPFLPILRVVKDLIAESANKQALWESHASVLGRVFPEIARELGSPRSSLELPGEDGRIQLFDALYRLLGEFSREKPLLILIHDLHRADQGTVDFLQYLARNVFLDERARRREPDAAPEVEPDDAWKHIRRRDGRTSGFITETLEGEGRGGVVDGPVARIMVVANYLEVGAEAADSEEEGTPDFDPEVAAHLTGLEDEPHVMRISLPPLDRSEAELLVQRTLGGRSFDSNTTDRLHEHANGNPFRLVELCRCLFEADLIPTEAVTGDGPIEFSGSAESLDALLADASDESGITARRLASLDATDAQIVRTLAALRRPVQSSVLVEITGEKADDVAASIARLLERDFVSRQRGRDKERFYLVHEDYVRVAYAKLTEEERRALHESIARVLAADSRASEPVRTFEIYEHFRRSLAPLEAVPFGIEAAHYFSGAYAVDLAARIGTGILDLVKEAPEPESIEDEQHWDILELSGRLELRRNELPAAKGHVKRLLEEKSLDRDRRLRTSLLLAEIYRAGGESHKGIKILNRLPKQVSDLTEGDKARIAAELARLRLERQDPKRASNVVLTALKDLDAVEEADTSAERILLLEVLAQSHLARREIVSAIQVYQQLLELVELHGDPSQLAETLNALGRLYYDRGNYFRAARYLFRALDAIRRVQDLRALSRAYDMLGKVYRNSGDTLRGIEYFHRSLRLRERVGDTEGISPTLNSLGSLYSHRGEYVEAIRYFQRSVEISERVGDTAGIVRAFLHLGRSYLDVGELRQVESLAKQILILSQEFNLVELEGEGHRLHGDLAIVRGDLKHSERELRKAVEIAAKRGRKSGEGSATLSLGALLTEKEEYEAALKQISKGQLLAEEIQSVPLQVRAQLLKGNVYRFLKGGNNERAKECFRRGLELVSGENQLPLQWELDYSISKVFQSNLEFVEASESYRRAQRILDRIVDRLPEDMRVTYTEDRRRKTFYDDYRRFEKESSGRMTMPQSGSGDVPRQERVWRLPEKPVAEAEAAPASVDADRILETAGRLAGSGRAGVTAIVALVHLIAWERFG